MAINESAIKAIVRTPMFKMRVVEDKKRKEVRNNQVNLGDALNEYYDDIIYDEDLDDMSDEMRGLD